VKLDTISVVVISRNEGRELRTTVDALMRTLPKTRREIIVVDDA
jgi:glycosyltransferase involved in cell wall biosynthesis